MSVFPDLSSTSFPALKECSDSLKVWNLQELYDFSSSEYKTAWESNIDHHDKLSCVYHDCVYLQSLNNFSFNHADERDGRLILINLKTKTNRTIPVRGLHCTKVDRDGKVILISSDRKSLQVFHLEMKSKIADIRTEKEFHFADWLDSENIVFVEGSSLCKLNISQQDQQQEVIIENIPGEFNKDITGVIFNMEMCAIQTVKKGEYSFYLYKSDLKVGQIVGPNNAFGVCLMEDSKKLVLLSSNGLLFKDPTVGNITEPVLFSEKAYMTHYFKESQLVAFVGYKGDSGVIDLSSKKLIARHDFKTEIVNSFKTDDSLVIVTKGGKVIECCFNAEFMLHTYRNNYDVSTEIMAYWKRFSESNIKDFRLSSIQSILPLQTPLNKYNRDYYIPHGGIHIFHPIISYYFPYMYQCVIRNELSIEYTTEEQNIIKDFVSYLIYRGQDLKIDRDNYLKWMFIFDRCWFEFTELESKIVTLFNNDFGLILPEISPLLQTLTEYQSRNLNFENGLLQKCINYCRDTMDGKEVSQVEPFINEHIPIRLSIDCIYNRQDTHDITLVAYGRKIGAHKTVLASTSPILEVMLDEEGSFKSEVTENQELVLGGEDLEIPEKDREKKGELFELLVKFCYTSSVDCSPEDAFLLYEMADQYQITDLKTSLADKIIAQLNLDTFMEIVKWSDIFVQISNKHLHRGILNFASLNGMKLLELYSDQLVAYPEFLVRFLKFSFNVE
ncbi:predicted protein [Naegleria gruberi]|uniref:Predicted protein n=1 Tax=Naegleria gruberi TaxID=5762 RepID=D2W2I4_NAEGR|nr:uncharacterized protein NAEGRDRAFT_75598 [Naegleria gruberi]EFC36718.1 predicted protein [Naegleria gruberi]|eukprot:XP_002669462.1 predicted protein [Naegleria gruberi strain NEG-M]